MPFNIFDEAKNGNFEYIKLKIHSINPLGFLTLKDLEQYPAVKNEIDRSLVAAVSKGHYYIVKFFLESRADVHYDSDVAIQEACRLGRKRCVELLLDYGADIHVFQDQPLLLAAQNGHEEIVEILLKRGNFKRIAMTKCGSFGVDANINSMNSILIAFVVQEKGHTEIAKCILDHVLENRRRRY